MSGRNQSVQINGSLSSPFPWSFGVPQGSVLDPLVFILYTLPPSNLTSSFKNISHHLYADDTQIYITLQGADLAQLLRWMTLNQEVPGSNFATAI